MFRELGPICLSAYGYVLAKAIFFPSLPLFNFSIFRNLFLVLELSRKENNTKVQLAAKSIMATTTSIWYFAGAAFLYQFAVVIYRLYFSPLAKFPGPKIAAATAWYEGFFDLWKANFPGVLEALHDEYGTNEISYRSSRSWLIFRSHCPSQPNGTLDQRSGLLQWVICNLR